MAVPLNRTLVFGSGVSSLSACSGEEAFSGPEEKSISILPFCGVLKEGARKRVFLGVSEKRKVWELGSRRAGGSGLSGELNSSRFPIFIRRVAKL